MDTADQTARVGGPEMWLYWQDYSRPVQSDQLSPIGADMTSATSLSLSIYNLLLYEYCTVCNSFFLNYFFRFQISIKILTFLVPHMTLFYERIKIWHDQSGKKIGTSSLFSR